jgi:aspartate kinase
MKTIVMKFGGSSIGITPGMTQLLSIVLHEVERWDQVILVVSALDGVTDRLIEAAQFALMSSGRGYRRIVATLRTRHFALIHDLPLKPDDRAALGTELDRILFDMHDACQQLGDAARRKDDMNVIDGIMDRIIGTGERLAARIIAALLRQSGMRAVAIDATDVIVTDEEYGSANPLMALTQARIDAHFKPLLGRDILPVVTGFIGATSSGAPTTLGRGGSDYTASVIAACTDAAEVRVYSDVDGMMSADPNVLTDARVIPHLHYDEAGEMAFFGARLLHTRMITPLQRRHIPVRVQNIFHPQSAGTLIDNALSPSGVKAVTVIDGLLLTAPRSGEINAVTRFVEGQFSRTVGGHIEATLISQSAAHTAICFIIPTYTGPDALHMLQSALAPKLPSLEPHTPWAMQPVGVITLVGRGVGGQWRLIARLISTLEEMRILCISRNPSDDSVSFVLPPDQVERALPRLHECIMTAAD